MIEAALADCDMLTQLCRKYNTAPLPPINRVYLAREKKEKKKEKKNKSGSYIEAWPFFSPHHFPSRKRWKGAILLKKENPPRIWNRNVERSKSLGLFHGRGIARDGSAKEYQKGGSSKDRSVRLDEGEMHRENSRGEAGITPDSETN